MLIIANWTHSMTKLQVCSKEEPILYFASLLGRGKAEGIPPPVCVCIVGPYINSTKKDIFKTS